MTDTTGSTGPAAAGERRDLIVTLALHRSFLRQTVEGLTDEQAGRRTTSSQLCLGGIVKHVTRMESRWVAFIGEGPAAMGPADEVSAQRHADSFRMLAGDTLTGLLAAYDEVATATERVVTELPSLDVAQPLPEAPWFEPGARWTARRTLLHVLAETSQHAGHADIIREALDGARTMG